MIRSMRGAQGHGRLTGEAAVIRRLTLEQEREPASQMPGYVTDDWADPGGEHVTLPSPHVSSVSDDDQIFT